MPGCAGSTAAARTRRPSPSNGAGVGPQPAVARVRHAVRTALAELTSGDLVLVGCSGGADSLALAAACAFEAPRTGLRAGAVTVDHGLQPGSADRAAALAARLTERSEERRVGKEGRCA